MTTVEGKYGTKATVLKDSISPQGIRLISFEVEYWRGILAELNTHRNISKSSASSRAIPFKKMQEQLRGRPTRMGQANPGMQDKGEDYDANVTIESELWAAFAAYFAVAYEGANFSTTFPSSPITVAPEVAWDFHCWLSKNLSSSFNDAGFHKQVYNRLTESHQMMKTVLTGTEWNNVFWLRDHDAADPSFHNLAHCLNEAKAQSQPVLLRPGEWHLPYVDDERNHLGELNYFIDIDESGMSRRLLTLDDAIKVSAARSAAVSFRNVDYGVEKSIEVHGRLVGDERKHASAFEHQATPMFPYAYELRPTKLDDEANSGLLHINNPFDPFTWEPGVSHVDRDGQLWSGNLRGWVQNRKLIDGENIPG